MIYYYGLWFLGGGKIIQLLDLIVFDTVVKYKLRQKLDKKSLESCHLKKSLQ